MLNAGVCPDTAALFAPFINARRILVAVSGGPDSLALLWLAAQWAQTPEKPRVEAATVDHGMRPDARLEAQMVSQVAKSLGIPHHILEWTGPKATARIQERAREARYRLLDDCATHIGADVLLTAHHADDQAETILFRLLRGSGVSGLAGMAAIVKRGAITHGRPFLGLTKQRLIDVCNAAGLQFVTDPSNEDPRFARTGLRRLTGLLAEEGLGAPELQRLATRAARIDAAVTFLTEQTLLKLGAQTNEGAFSVSFDSMRQAPAELMLRVLMVEIGKISGTKISGTKISGTKPRLDRAEALAEKLTDALRRHDPIAATLGGALVRLSAAGQLTLTSEGPRGAPKDPGIHTDSSFSRLPKKSEAPSLGKAPCEP